MLLNLEARADGAGMLPVWTEWWTEDELAAAVPDAVVRARIAAEQHRLPLAYFRSHLPTPGGWDSGACAYLAFGDTYLEERGQAADRGWPVVTMAGDHLHMVVDPAGVARELLGLLDVLGISSSSDDRRRGSA